MRILTNEYKSPCYFFAEAPSLELLNTFSYKSKAYKKQDFSIDNFNISHFSQSDKKAGKIVQRERET